MSSETIDGDKIIAFIDGVKNLGIILERLNVLEISGAFKVGKKIDAIDRLIDIEKSWGTALAEINKTLSAEVVALGHSQQECKRTVRIFEEVSAMVKLYNLRGTTETIKEFCDVCDRLEKIKSQGTIELVAGILNSKSPVIQRESVEV